MAAAVTASPLRVLVDSARREWTFLWRSPWDLALASWLPGVCVGLLAWLLSAGVIRDLPIALVDDDRSAASRDLARLLDAAPGVRVTSRPEDLESAFAKVRSLDVYAVVYVPRDVSRQIERGERGTIVAYYNASYSTAGSAALREITAAVQTAGARLSVTDVARARGPRLVRASPVALHSSFLFNPARSYELYLLALLAPALLHFALCLSVAGAFGRELRDRTVASWLPRSMLGAFAAAAGKTLPYLLLIAITSAASVIWLTGARGHGIRGSLAVLLGGQLLLFLAYAAAALFFVGLTRTLSTALSIVSLYAGTSMAFAGITFSIEGAGGFARAWNRAMPFASYAHLQTLELYATPPWSVARGPLLFLAAYTVTVGGLGLLLYYRAARDPRAWGRR